MRRRRGRVFDDCPLTRGELEALCALATGHTAKGYALATGRSESTIRTLLANAYRRLNVAGATQAAIHCWKQGWILVDGFDAQISPVPVPPPKIARADQVTPEQKLYAEALVRSIRSDATDDDHQEARVLLRIVRRKAAERGHDTRRPKA